MAGERIAEAEVDKLGIAGDRKVLVKGRNGRVITSRTHPKLLGLKGTIAADGVPHISGQPWNSMEALDLVCAAAGPRSEVFYYEGPERFDVLPLLVATDGAIAAFGYDGRRLRPNLVISGVEGLADRTWPGQCLQIGDVKIGVQDLRARCIMTTFDPDTLQQDHRVLKEIVRKFDGELALNCYVIQGGSIRLGDTVQLVQLDECQQIEKKKK